MSVLVEMSMFPTDRGESKSEYVARVVGMIRESGYPFQLTPMSTVVETETVAQALALVEKGYALLEDCNRVYATIKIDRRKGDGGRMQQKVESVTRRLDPTP